MKIESTKWSWIREPKDYSITDDKIEIVTAPHTDLWQRTYYHFRNDNAPVLQMKTSEKYFSFIVKTEFESKQRFDQCGVVMYLDSDNWLSRREDDYCIECSEDGINQGRAHKSKPFKKVTIVEGEIPDWFRKGVNAVLLAPTAINQQKFTFILKDGKVQVKDGLGFCIKTDVGIVKYHFELAAGKENFSWVN